MKRFVYLTFGLIAAMLLWLPVSSVLAEAPKVPITYEGDTPETIARRAGWIEEAKKEGKLVYWGTLRPNLANDFITRFNKIYPFIKIQYWRGRGEEIASKVEAEYASGVNNVDILLGGEPYNYPRWRKMGIIAKFTDFIPGIKNIPSALYSKNGDWFVAGNNAITPQYNTNLVTAAEAPKTWEDLLDPKWKGHIGMTRDTKVWSTLALSEGGWGVEKTEQYLLKLAKQNPIWATGHTAGHMLLIAGEFKIMVEEYVYHAILSRQKGAPVDWVRITPVAITGSSHTFPARAPHPNAARLFLEWQFSPQGLAAYEEITAKGSAFPGTGTRISKALAGLDLCLRTEDVVLKVIELDLDKRFSKALGIQE